jgi:PEP-CTERM motif
MKGISLGSFRLMGLGRHWCAGALAGAILLSGSRAGAAPIRHEDLSSADATAFKEWSRYLLAGPSVWQEVLHPPVTPAVRSAIWESVRTDPGGADPMVHYLLWKQSLDPTRFAFYHPKLAPALDKIIRAMPTAPQQLIPPSVTSSSGTPSTTTNETPTSSSIPSEQGLNPPPAPEPSTLLLALGMAGWGIWRSRRGKSNP